MATVDALAAALPRAASGSLPVAARDLAAAGVPVFPCVPGGKRPLTRHGFHDATTDPEQVSAWWQQYSGANIGLPTGVVSGVVVVDVDVHGPVSGFAALERAERAGLVDGWRFLVDTPSGGMHVYYPAIADVVQPSWQAAGVGVDFRGDGGYIIVPPSVVTSDDVSATYRVRQVATSAAHPVAAGRLRDFLDPRPSPISRPRRGLSSRADVSGLAAWVATRGEGERNRGLFWAACRLAETGMPPSDALDVLTVAATTSGLSEREIITTVRSAYRTARPESVPRADRKTYGFDTAVAVRRSMQMRGL